MKRVVSESSAQSTENVDCTQDYVILQKNSATTVTNQSQIQNFPTVNLLQTILQKPPQFMDRHYGKSVYTGGFKGRIDGAYENLLCDYQAQRLIGWPSSYINQQFLNELTVIWKEINNDLETETKTQSVICHQTVNQIEVIQRTHSETTLSEGRILNCLEPKFTGIIPFATQSVGNRCEQGIPIEQFKTSQIHRVHHLTFVFPKYNVWISYLPRIYKEYNIIDVDAFPLEALSLIPLDFPQSKHKISEFTVSLSESPSHYWEQLLFTHVL